MENLHCQKRRHIVKRKKDGSCEKMYRCANSVANNYKHTVDNLICEKCSLRQPLLKLASICKGQPPSKATWPEPYYGEGGDIIYPFQEGVSQPPTPQGYKRKSTEGLESWWFITEWDQCPYRLMANQRTPRGDLQVRAYCTVQNNRSVKHEECKQCLIDLVAINGSLDKETIVNSIPVPEPIKEQLEESNIPAFPGTVELLDNYWKAIRRWITAGRPTREDMDVQKIHNEFCIPCDWYDLKSQRCKGCGCKVKPKGVAVLNKIKMKTEHCPRAFW